MRTGRTGRHSSITFSRIKVLEDIGFQWIEKNDHENKRSGNDDVWLKMYEELKNFKSSEGHCNVPHSFAQTSSLRVWVKAQRRMYRMYRQTRIDKRSSITFSRIKRLNDIGFQWIEKNDDPGKEHNGNDDPWLQKYEELKKFKFCKGHCNVSKHFGRSKSLRQWVNRQRHECKKIREGKPSSMTLSRIDALNDLGFQWNMLEDNWLYKYEELKQFKSREGHFNVPLKGKKNISLSIWVCKQRQQYKYMVEGKPSSITQLRIKSLENIGFQWSEKKACRNTQNLHNKWVMRYGQLRRFKCRNGHFNIPKYTQFTPLRNWVGTQRLQYKNMREGKHTRLTEQRIQALDAIGFTWNTKNEPETTLSYLIKSESSI